MSITRIEVTWMTWRGYRRGNLSAFPERDAPSRARVSSASTLRFLSRVVARICHAVRTRISIIGIAKCFRRRRERRERGKENRPSAR